MIAFNVADHPSTAQMSSHISDILNEMEDSGVKFTRDYLAGLVLQNGLSSEPELQDEFNRRIETDFQFLAPKRLPMSFEGMVRLVDVIRRQQQFQSSNRGPTQPQPLAMQASVQNAETNPTPPSDANLPMFPSHPDNTPGTQDYMVMQAGLCWMCRSPEHLLRNCPLRARGGSNKGRFRGPQQAHPLTQQGPNGGFQSFYPIVTPPGFTGVYPQSQPMPHTQQTPAPLSNSVRH
ncbi:uncharacterized protein PGTG_19398 [Puccinia graminis f. sp. tritici CRL 75-36-700-3]|uniref:CCHC-type domain-containing protein n=1 Tax=Puccinia graminis f. sp. tritici (strain CRL 75-36-700-3 / race SCCL) TaxID=418459 RepID=E3LA05_PUCGT|nr:uncharacterized protein PGTG_19398 [Puccinia graminis f. sp. tritici CRL 75-36-700-3]EFP93380.1 hypothetical protein PGTG_19398 [Puccinia graminis f. sp. tritici CRL 75-36-700-3]